MPRGPNSRGLEVIQDLLPADLLDDGREHVGGGAVVHEVRCPAALSIGQPRKAFTQSSVSTMGQVGSLPLPTDMVSRSFTRKAAKCSLTWLGQLLREERDNPVVHPKLAFRHGKAHCRGGEAFAQRIERVVVPRTVRRPPSFGHHPAVADQHKAVQLMFALPQGFEVSQHSRRLYALGFRRAARELAGGGDWPARPARGNKRKQPQSRRSDTSLPKKCSAIQCHPMRIWPSRPEIQAKANGISHTKYAL